MPVIPLWDEAAGSLIPGKKRSFFVFRQHYCGRRVRRNIASQNSEVGAAGGPRLGRMARPATETPTFKKQRSLDFVGLW